MTAGARGGAAVVAVGAISALGEGWSAARVPGAGEPATCAIAEDAELREAGLTRPFAARCDLAAEPSGDVDRAERLLGVALDGCLGELDVALPGWRGGSIGVAVGTSAGAMRAMSRWLTLREDGATSTDLASRVHYAAPFARALEARGLDPAALAKRACVLGACAASTVALGLALRWLRRGACDVVLAGGYDAASVFVAAGFEALRATSASRPMPFAANRDGLALGEGACVLALVREDDPRARATRVHGRVLGFGAATDAVHITAPDRSGGGLARAATAALDDAGLDAHAIDLVSAHATATPFNDAMEARAIATVLGSRTAPPVVHAFKASVGHALGAAGALETLAALDALARGLAPATHTRLPCDPDATARLVVRSEPLALSAALKLSAAFGGLDAALVLAPPATEADVARPRRAPRNVAVRARARVDGEVDLAALEAATGVPRDRLARLDGVGRLGLAAVAALAARVGREHLRGAGIVAGHALATLDTNARFAARLRARGATHVEGRLFPATSPNAVAGECAIPFGLTGPSFAAGGAPDAALEALACAAELVAAGDADRMVVLAVDEAGATSAALMHELGATPLTRGAIALLLEVAAPGESALELDAPTRAPDGAPGHLALASL